MTRWSRMALCACGLALALAPGQAHAQFDEELDEFFVRIEMNASDGDVGAHIKLDGEGWEEMQVRNPGGDPLYDLEASNELSDQGQTENVSESTEPPCFDPGDGEAFQTLADFLLRFVEGEYEAEGVTLEGDSIGATYELSHEIPAAPNISKTDGRRFELDDDSDSDGDSVKIRWKPGDDFGECSNGDGADDGGLEPAGDVDLWEVTVEPADDEAVEEAGLELAVFTVQLAAKQRKVSVPREYFRRYLKAGIEEFKFEVGAKLEENQTFSEGEFAVERDD